MMTERKKRILIILSLLRKNNLQKKLVWAHNRYRRRRLVLTFLKMYMDNTLPFDIIRDTRKVRKVWSFSRPQFTFEENFYNYQISDPNYWKRNFRMSRETFLKIVAVSSDFMMPSLNHVRAPVFLEKRVAIVLNWLATGNSYNSVGEAFGVHKATVIRFVNMFMKGMLPLRNEFMKFPKTLSEYEHCINSFSEKTNLPNVMGTIDGTHVQIVKPEGLSAFDYFSRKQKYTIVNQAVCDGNLIFLSVDTGYPGSIHDSRMLEHSWIYNAAENNTIMNAPITKVSGTDMTPYLLGDPAYPLLKWLMKPYAHGTKGERRKNFNYQLSKARSCIERSFGLLKTRFRILDKKNEFFTK